MKTTNSLDNSNYGKIKKSIDSKRNTNITSNLSITQIKDVLLIIYDSASNI